MCRLSLPQYHTGCTETLCHTARDFERNQRTGKRIFRQPVQPDKEPYRSDKRRGSILSESQCASDNIHETTSKLYDLGKQVAPIRIGIPPLLSTVFFPDMLTAFYKKYPDTPVELFEYGSVRAANLVLEDTLDLALVNLNFYETNKLNSCQLLSDQLVFCVSREHPLVKEKSVSVEMLKDEPLIMYNTDSVQNQTLLSIFDSIKVKPHVILNASQLYTIQAFVQKNLGGAILYSSLLKNMHGIKGIPITPTITQEIGLVWQKGRYLNSSTEKFISFTKDFMQL